MSGIRFFLAVTMASLALVAGGCTLDKNTPSGWQGGGGWDNFRA